MQLLFQDGFEVLTEPTDSYQPIAGMHQMLMDDLEFSKKVAAQIHLSAIYEIADPKNCRRLLKESGHRLLRVPPPPTPTRGTAILERTESRDTLPVILAVPNYMHTTDVALLLRAWCSTNDEVSMVILWIVAAVQIRCVFCRCQAMFWFLKIQESEIGLDSKS